MDPVSGAGPPARRMLLAGAAGDVGRAVHRLAGDRHVVAGVDRRDRPPGWDGPYRRVHVRDEASAARVAAHARADLGHVDAVVLAWGSYPRRPLPEYDERAVLDVLWDNVLAGFFLVQALLPGMVERGTGRVVFVTSGAASTGGLDPAYAASKAALTALMKSVAREYGRHGIAANAVAPGPLVGSMSDVMTAERKAFYASLAPNGRLSAPSSVARALLFLAEQEGNEINGSTIDVDGGLLRR